MSTVAEILSHAMALAPDDRATIAQSLIRSLPSGPTAFESEEQLAAELNRRMSAYEAGQAATYRAEDTLRRAREAVGRVRGS